MERLQDEITKLRREVEEIKHIIREDFELSDWAKRRLKEYEEGKKKFITHEKVKREFGG